MPLPRTLLTLLLLASASAQAPPPITVADHRIAGPKSPADFPTWLRDLRQYRTDTLASLHYSGAEYDRPELRWTQSSFLQPQMMVEDRFFYDPIAGRYTVDRYLDDLTARYGGIDSVLVWPSYPNMGIDDRNQFDRVADLPGGLPGVRQMVADFHRRGVRVLFPIMPWDHGTRDPGIPFAQAVAQEMAAIDADGINGDTMTSIGPEFRAASDKTGHPIAFEAEVFGNDSALAFNNLGWAYAVPIHTDINIQTLNPGGFSPEFVEKYKWLEPRHMAHIDDRWQRDKTIDLQYAFFNGIGLETWENVWGIWNGITPRDAAAIRRIALIDRAFAPLLISPDWEPHTPTLQYGVYASRWPGPTQTLFTLINRNEFDLTAKQGDLPEQLDLPYTPGQHFYDLWNGTELTPTIHPAETGAKATLSFPMEAHGFAAILLTNDPPKLLSSPSPLCLSFRRAAKESAVPARGNTACTITFPQLLAHLHTLAATPLNSLSTTPTILKQTLVPIPPTKPASTAPPGMVLIPAATFDFQVAGVEIEGGNLEGVDVQYPWEPTPSRHHHHTLQIPAFYIDRTPVTNAEFKRFLDATHYHPADDHFFLHHWKEGTYPEGAANQPVTWVGIEDARAYAAWARKRLPHEWEWQYAAQFTDHRTYPWGNTWDPAAVPTPETGRTLRAPDNVTAHPSGASPFGLLDLTANVWQWTDEYRDDHTRAAILRGGSLYKPQGSIWYFPQAYDLHQHGKYLLMSPGRDRAATIGFRCAVDTTSQP